MGTGRGVVVRVVMSAEASSSARRVLVGSWASLWESACEVRSTSEVDADCAGVRGGDCAWSHVDILIWWVLNTLIRVDGLVALRATRIVGELVSVKMDDIWNKRSWKITEREI